jgi:CBS domain-containing protein
MRRRARAVVVRMDGPPVGSPGSEASAFSDNETPMNAQETMIGWADVRDILREFITVNAQVLSCVSEVSKWTAKLDVVAAEFCARKLVNVTGDDGQLLPQLHAGMTLLQAVTEGASPRSDCPAAALLRVAHARLHAAGFLSTGGADERTLTPRSGGAAGGQQSVVHRIAFFSHGQISSILSQSDIMTYLYRHSELLGAELARASVDSLGFASGKRVVCVTPNTPTHAAFAVMFSNHVSAVGVVAPGSEELIANLSASDMRCVRLCRAVPLTRARHSRLRLRLQQCHVISRLEPRHFSVLALPVAEFLADASGQAVAGIAPAQRGGSFLEFARQSAGVRAPVAITPATPFLRVLELLGGTKPRIHRVYVTEAGRPIGVVRFAPWPCLLELVCLLTCRAARADHAYGRAALPGGARDVI